jgi:hypothetical protein
LHQFTCNIKKGEFQTAWAGFEASLVTDVKPEEADRFYTITQRHVALTVDVVMAVFFVEKRDAPISMDKNATAAVLAQLPDFRAQLLRSTGVAGTAAGDKLLELFKEHTALARQYALEIFKGDKAASDKTLDKLVNGNGKAMHAHLAEGHPRELAEQIGKLFMQHLTTTAAYIAALNGAESTESADFWRTVWVAVETGRELGNTLDKAYPVSRV